MRIGVIGTGNIGGMLAKAFATNPGTELFVYNRTQNKAYALAESTANIFVSASLKDVALQSDIIFVCTKPGDGKLVLAEIGPYLTDQQLLVATISSLPLQEVESMTAAGVAKVIPSILQCQKNGILLVTYGPSMLHTQRRDLDRLLRTISTPFEVEEHQIRIASDLASCGPAFMAQLLLWWAEAAADRNEIGYAQAEHLLTTTWIGVANLLSSGLTLHDIIAKVSVPGGVTEAGLSSLGEAPVQLFKRLHKTTSHHSHGSRVVNLSRR